MESENRKAVNEIVKRWLDEVPQTEPTFEQMGADSLDLIEMLMALEERFEIEIKDEDAEKLKTVTDVCAYLAEAGV